MAISAKAKQIFADHGANQHIFALATASKSGVPNVVPIGFLFVANDDEIWVIDNYLNKTLANVRENPVAAVYAQGGENGKECIQVKGKVTYEDSGADYEACVTKAHAVNPAFPAKGLFKIKVSCEFDTAPGPNAGKKL